MRYFQHTSGRVRASITGRAFELAHGYTEVKVVPYSAIVIGPEERPAYTVHPDGSASVGAGPRYTAGTSWEGLRVGALALLELSEHFRAEHLGGAS